MKMKSKYNKRQLKKLNKKATKILIANGTFNENDFSDNGKNFIFIFKQKVVMNMMGILHLIGFGKLIILNQLIIYNPEINHVREKYMFKLRNAKHIFKC